MDDVEDRNSSNDTNDRAVADSSRHWSSISFKSILKSLGPGIITGAADDDPSGIATYSQAGASFGFGMLWMALSISSHDSYPRDLCKNRAYYRRWISSVDKEKIFEQGIIASCQPSLDCQYNKHRSRYRCHGRCDEIGRSTDPFCSRNLNFYSFYTSGSNTRSIQTVCKGIKISYSFIVCLYYNGDYCRWERL